MGFDTVEVRFVPVPGEPILVGCRKTKGPPVDCLPLFRPHGRPTRVLCQACEGNRLPGPREEERSMPI